MAEKQPDSFNKTKQNVQPNAPSQTPGTKKDEGIPPASHVKDKATAEQLLPESDEETEEERLKRAEEERIEDEEAGKMAKEMLMDEEKKSYEEDDKIMKEIEQSAEERLLAEANKNTQVEPLSLTDDFNNEHGPQSKINEQLKHVLKRCVCLGGSRFLLWACGLETGSCVLRIMWGAFCLLLCSFWEGFCSG